MPPGLRGRASAHRFRPPSGRGAAWSARLFWVQEVVGSNPAAPTNGNEGVSCARVSTSRQRPPCNPAAPRRPDPLMGWIGSADTQAQVRLTFATREEAVAYADKYGIAYDLELPQERHMKPKAYADNFRYG